jgi:hypothetical protein
MYALELQDFNYAAVFGIALGIYFIQTLDFVVRDAMTFVKGWHNT